MTKIYVGAGKASYLAGSRNIGCLFRQVEGMAEVKPVLISPFPQPLAKFSELLILSPSAPRVFGHAGVHLLRSGHQCIELFLDLLTSTHYICAFAADFVLNTLLFAKVGGPFASPNRNVESDLSTVQALSLILFLQLPVAGRQSQGP